MASIVRNCLKCNQRLVITKPTQDRYKKYNKDERELYFCPACRKNITEADLNKATIFVTPANPTSNEKKPIASKQETLRNTSSQTTMPKQRTAKSEKIDTTKLIASIKDQDCLPNDYLADGYHDKNGIRRWYFTDGANTVAKVLAKQSHPSMSITALRRFYNQLHAIKLSYAMHHDFNVTRTSLYSVKTIVVNAVARKVVPQEFQVFIERNLKLALQDVANFHAFMEHYQSVLAYARHDNGYLRTNDIKADKLPKGYLKQGYYDSKGYLRKEIFIDYPQELAVAFQQAKPTLSYTALRNFYNKLKGIEMRLQGDSFGSILQLLYTLERDAIYAFNRKIIPEEFAAFILMNVNLAIVGEAEFYGFAEHFQAVVAYGRQELRT